MCRIIREIMQQIKNEAPSNRRFDIPDRIQASAIEALQMAAEAFGVGLFANAHMCAMHANRVTVMCAPLPFWLLLTCAQLTLCTASCWSVWRVSAASAPARHVIVMCVHASSVLRPLHNNNHHKFAQLAILQSSCCLGDPGAPTVASGRHAHSSIM